MEIILQNIETVGDIIDALSKLPRNTEITPFGDPDAMFVYDKENNRLYLDNNIFLEEEFGVNIESS
ncbi:MAG: hypothetical protein K6C13_15520 [Oscillospiraceae bacterium]|nr:hypothetical protein [Oscillospiraceae bacterium]